MTQTKSELAEIRMLVRYLGEHPEYVLTGGSHVRAECATCGDTVRTTTETGLAGIPCAVCGNGMSIRRDRNARIRAKYPYVVFTYGFATAGDPCGAWPENVLG